MDPVFFAIIVGAAVAAVIWLCRFLLSPKRSVQEVYPNNKFYPLYKTPEDAAGCGGTLVMSIYSKPGKQGNKIDFYRDPNGKTVLVDHSHQLASRSGFYFDAMPLKNDSYTYHPAKTVYTGVTVGGVHTGGTHTDPAHYSQSQSSSGNAVPYLNFAKNLDYFLVSCVQLYGNLVEKAKSAPELEGLGGDGYYLLYGRIPEAERLAYNSAMLSGSVYTAMSARSFLASSAGLPTEKCSRIAAWLTSAAKGLL